jgi:hypothetical protein
MLESLNLIVVQYRDRRKGIRRTYQVAELIPTGETGENIVLKPNILYRCKPTGEIVAHDECVRIFDILNMHTGMSRKELTKDMTCRMDILKWLVENKVTELNDVGKIIAEYYNDSSKVLDAAVGKKNPSVILKL